MRRGSAATALGALALAGLALPATLLAEHAAPKVEKRCGILSNPTPANWWLTDHDGEWTLGVQGGYRAEGLATLPASLFEDGWVRVNGYYGYRCACLRVEADPASRRVTRVYAGLARPMSACTTDRALQRALSQANP